jgi:hypothetical protein
MRPFAPLELKLISTETPLQRLVGLYTAYADLGRPIRKRRFGAQSAPRGRSGIVDFAYRPAVAGASARVTQGAKSGSVLR